METIDLFQRVGLALAIGMLMGVERGWQARDLPEGMRAAGIRTFTLIGILGGVAGVFTATLGPLALAAPLLALAALVVASHMARARSEGDLGMTTEVAELVCFVLGALAAMGEMAVAAAGAVVATALLGAKQTLHGALKRVEELELMAAIKLLLISVVLLPVLPDRGYGPGEVLNPFKLWLLVVLVAAISFVGYFAIKLAGPRIGSLLTGLFGGLASSTALTVSFARMGRDSPALQPVLAAGVALANTTMYVRLWVIVMLLNGRVGRALMVPVGAMAATGLLATWVLWRSRAEGGKPGQAHLSNPFELGMALKFAFLLALVMLASKLLQATVGSAGLYLLAAVAGLADVDAIALSMAHMGGRDATIAVATAAIVVAVFVNTAVKAALVFGLCGGLMAWRIGLAVLAMTAAGAVGLAVEQIR
ncbi:MAG: MgtC/SapB family protein [Magnetospirillum sp.]|nr:MgtC/SapB family protein [Magnetospirillum sp.]